MTAQSLGDTLASSWASLRGGQGAWRTRGCKGRPSPDARPSQGRASHPKVPVDTLPWVASPCTLPAMPCGSSAFEQPRVPGCVSAPRTRAGRRTRASGAGGGQRPAATRRGPGDGALRDGSPPRACTGSAASLARVTSGRGRAPGESRVETVLGEVCRGLVRLTVSLGGVPGVPSVTGRDVHGPPSPLTRFPKSAAGSAQCHLHCLTGHPARPSVYSLPDSWLVRGGHCVTTERPASTASRGRPSTRRGHRLPGEQPPPRSRHQRLGGVREVPGRGQTSHLIPATALQGGGRGGASSPVFLLRRAHNPGMWE